LLFFASFSKIENSAKNGQKVKAIYSLAVLMFLASFKNRLKMDEK
jgi:hypothetical protein